MKVLFIESFYTGSHRLFLEGFKEHSRHQLDQLTLPGRAWKWRLRAGALCLRDELEAKRGQFDLLFVSSLFPLSDALGLCPWLSEIPRVMYMHENEAAYPVPKGKQRENQFVLIQLNACLASDRILYNSQFNLDSFISGITEVLEQAPDAHPSGVQNLIQDRSSVVGLGIDFEELDRLKQPKDDSGTPIIAWNHRWEFDKNPEEFFEVLLELKNKNVQFRLAILGGTGNFEPKLFKEMKEVFNEEIVHFGHIADRSEYLRKLSQCHIAVSTSRQDFFGISMVESAWCGLDVVVPNRLAYPEILGDIGRYFDSGELESVLVDAIGEASAGTRKVNCDSLSRFSWKTIAARIDDELDGVAETRGLR